MKEGKIEMIHGREGRNKKKFRRNKYVCGEIRKLKTKAELLKERNFTLKKINNEERKKLKR